jgi:hypothetical protein
MKMKGFKGFNAKLQCRDFQFEIGKEYEEQGARRCEYGFHFCENPLDVLKYYPPADSRYCEVEGSGEIDTGEIDARQDSKVAASKLKVEAEIGLQGLIEEGVRYIKSKVDWENDKETNTENYSAATNTGDYSAATNTGNRSAATNTGNCSAATNTGYQSVATNTGTCSAATNTGNCSVATNAGDHSAATNAGNHSVATNAGHYSAATNTGHYSAATNTGYYSAAINTGSCSAATNNGYRSVATNTGDYSSATNTGYQSVAINTGYDSVAAVEGVNSIACSLGVRGKAKGKKGCWLVLAQWEISCGYRSLQYVKSVLVDGEKIKEDTFYTLVDGQVVEVE